MATDLMLMQLRNKVVACKKHLMYCSVDPSPTRSSDIHLALHQIQTLGSETLDGFIQPAAWWKRDGAFWRSGNNDEAALADHGGRARCLFRWHSDGHRNIQPVGNAAWAAPDQSRILHAST